MKNDELIVFWIYKIGIEWALSRQIWGREHSYRGWDQRTGNDDTKVEDGENQKMFLHRSGELSHILPLLPHVISRGFFSRKFKFAVWLFCPILIYGTWNWKNPNFVDTSPIFLTQYNFFEIIQLPWSDTKLRKYYENFYFYHIMSLKLQDCKLKHFISILIFISMWVVQTLGTSKTLLS